MEEGYIEIPKDKIRDLVKKVYEMSRPVGMGFLHARDGELSEEDTDALIDLKTLNATDRFGRFTIVHMDYVHGRQCKMNVAVFKAKNMEDKFYIRDSWYDHSDRQLKELLDHLGVHHDPR